jgi:hypothetical protein
MSAIISVEFIISEYFAKFSPEEKLVNQFPFHITFIYGDADWMCSEGAQRVVASKVTSTSFVKLEKATH